MTLNSQRVDAVRAAMPASCHRRPSSRRAPARRAARGFTLIEIVVAFAILAVGLGLAMQIAGGAMRNARQAAQRTEAALYAKSLLDAAGVGERLEEGSDAGDFGEDYRWELEVSKYELELDGPVQIDPSMSPVQLYRLDLRVTWGEGRNESEARFVTLRALTPDAGGG
jgi:general secretion pathway protein I